MVARRGPSFLVSRLDRCALSLWIRRTPDEYWQRLPMGCFSLKIRATPGRKLWMGISLPLSSMVPERFMQALLRKLPRLRKTSWHVRLMAGGHGQRWVFCSLRAQPRRQRLRLASWRSQERFRLLSHDPAARWIFIAVSIQVRHGFLRLP